MKRTLFAVPLVLAALFIMAWILLSPTGIPPSTGDDAPAFTLLSNEGSEVALADYRGSWVVLYFYPRDFTRGCTIEARNFQRDLSLYEDRNTVILGVSVDDADSHRDFCAKEGLRFKLLADTDGVVSRAYGSLRDAAGIKLSARNTFIIGPDGVVGDTFIGVSPKPHSEEVLDALARLQS